MISRKIARVRGKKSGQAKRAATLAPVYETNVYYGEGAAAKKIRQKKSKITAKKERNRSSTKICGKRSSMLISGGSLHKNLFTLSGGSGFSQKNSSQARSPQKNFSLRNSKKSARFARKTHKISSLRSQNTQNSSLRSQTHKRLPAAREIPQKIVRSLRDRMFAQTFY